MKLVFCKFQGAASSGLLIHIYLSTVIWQPWTFNHCWLKFQRWQMIVMANGYHGSCWWNPRLFSGLKSSIFSSDRWFRRFAHIVKITLRKKTRIIEFFFFFFLFIWFEIFPALSLNCSASGASFFFWLGWVLPAWQKIKPNNDFFTTKKHAAE